VSIEVFGGPSALASFSAALRNSPPPAARITHCSETAITRDVGPATFAIEASLATDDRRVSIPPDLATCDACLSDIFDPANRRFRYAFTNCTNCGPRFTIAKRVPYDRPHTTMAAFVMCEACQAEYDDPRDRRFHAQPNACPACGPRLSALDADGRLVPGEPLAAAVEAIRHGRIVAIKGLGGFHLACDATDADAVDRLRTRKRRDEKPFAVMAQDLDAASRLARVSACEASLLASSARPIVLVDRLESCDLADNVAPHNPMVGLLLPYTPLHHLLIADVGRPLVMTSGNLSDEPLAHENDEALRRLSGIADVFLTHDRDIDTRCDDSVVRVIAGTAVPFRRSRGYTPIGIRLPFRFTAPVLACGGLLKNTFCIGVEDTAYLGPHIGDLENLETYESFIHAVSRMETFLGVSPAVVVHDLHPGYLSTRYATERANVIAIGVQHHHAHIAGALVESGTTGPALGVAFDGTGFGPDGTAWGGEFLLVNGADYARVGTFRPLLLAGGDTAITHVWRQGFAAIIDAYDGEPPATVLACLGDVPEQERRVVREMLRQSLNTFPGRGVGRFFDAAGAIGLRRPRARFEGQVALEWNLVAARSESGAYPWRVEDEDGVLTIDLRPMFRSLAEDAVRGVGPGLISARFHNTIANATLDMVGRLRTRFGPFPVALSGGCFQNARLTESIVDGLGSAVQVMRHQLVPPGDGGLALGQAAIAHAVVESGRAYPSEGVCASAFLAK
jgi:hydrogenase maturation protein HypF